MDTLAIPLFPLEIVLYPGEIIPLHIFEPKYKSMVRDCLSGGRSFGIVLFEEGNMADVGCLADIHEVLQEYPDGRLDIAVIGRKRFRVAKVIDEKEYMQCKADILGEPTEEIDRANVQRAITQHMKLLELAGHKVRPSIYQNVDRVSFLIARNAGLNLAQKQHILERDSENERISFLVGFLEEFIPRVQEMGEMRTKIRSNGHFKDFPSDEADTANE